jgi:branched-chain amino acid transport system permease protein
MTDFIQQIINGLLLGGIYALFAVGLTLSLGVLRVMNTAHGATLALSAILAVRVAEDHAISLPVFIVVAALVGCGIGILIDLLALRPLAAFSRGRSIEMPSLVATLGVLFMLQTVSQKLTDSQLINVPTTVVKDQLVTVGPFHFRSILLITFGLGVTLMLITWAVVNRTQLGRAIRAIAADSEAAEIIGIRSGPLKLVTMAASGALAGVAGALLGAALGAVDYGTGESQLLKGFCVVILGGIGSVVGALTGGLLLGLAEGLTIFVFGTSWQPAAAFVLLLLFLLVRPYGVFGRAQIDRA